MIRNQHIPIMTKEIFHSSMVKKTIYFRLYFGRGGHSKKFLESGHLVTAIDQDINSLRIAKKLKKEFNNFFFHKINFKDLDLLNLGKEKFDFILLDLGFSSDQLDNSKIGLSFKIDSNLNMNYLGGDKNAYK